ncbi:hypothetical protein N7510_000903 [Penicillium lagena]|uniref:uncharacterized protein n=1 Tax=Penicillium lagena TaxID=94218 RepID=UPI002541CF10|nr:uncharacterized protein N7510_000903 [Penicillium lagena]KAJ5624594.1 hypothetical protein N7510_000903 [Penicillium lagena]
MDAFPPMQTAIVGLPNGDLGVRSDVPLPSELADDMILVQNHVVGLNPVDTKMTGSLGTPGAIAGMDFAGTVRAIGRGVVTPAGSLAVGDRVCGAVQGMHSLTPRVGAFAQYVGATDHVTLRLPPTMSFAEGAALGSGISTVGLALFHIMRVPGYPDEPAQTPRFVLVYGGSTATGTLAIQLLKLSGLRPIATCSPRNFELVRSFGAEEVFDYRSSTAAADIRKHTRNSLKYVLDCISEPETMQFCYECIGRLGGRYTALEPYPSWLHTRSNVEPAWVLGPTLLGKDIGWREPFGRPRDPETKAFGVRLFQMAQRLLDEGKIRTHPLHPMPGGLQGVLDGMELLRQKQISGKKLVYSLDP